MSKYEKAKNIEECFIRAALRAENMSVKAMWYEKASEMAIAINEMSVEEAEQEV